MHDWLSIRNAKEICWKISDELCEIDEQNADIYRKNTESYVEGLRELEQKYADMADSLDKNTLIFGDRFAFRYLLDDYGFRYYAAFPGCSTDTEASFETIRFLASKVDETGAKYVMIAKGDSDTIAKTVIQNTRIKRPGHLSAGFTAIHYERGDRKRRKLYRRYGEKLSRHRKSAFLS